MTSGNHDSAARLGFQSALLRDGIHVVTDPLSAGTPITIDDAHGPVHFYGIPFLEPALVRHLWPDVELRSQHATIEHVMGLVRSDLAERGGRSVAIAHCFAAGVEATPGVEREIRQGSLDVVPLSAFEGPDYVALGHIHGRQQLSERVRYAGAPLHYSFGEADKPRGSWLVDLDAVGLASVEWLDLPVPRRLKTIRASLDELLTDARFAEFEDAWVCAQYTDATPQLDPMRRLQARFAYLRDRDAHARGRARTGRPDVLAAGARRPQRRRARRRVPHARARRRGGVRARSRSHPRRDRRALARGGDRVRLHRLELEGFGPFRERQIVDFDAFAADGIFLIAGRTGAGKSSVLDGVCFALYGGAPRYDGAEKRLRSDHCAPDDPTSVTVEFSAAGRRWRVTRSPEYERPKQRGTGLTTEPHRAQLDELVDGAWVGRAARPVDVARELDEILGLNQQQFLQVILLAQGRFAEFLLAKNDDRQRLLRKLFGTRTYEDYQSALEQRRKDAERALAAAGDGVVLLLGEAERLIDADGLAGEPATRPATPTAARAARDAPRPRPGSRRASARSSAPPTAPRPSRASGMPRMPLIARPRPHTPRPRRCARSRRQRELSRSALAALEARATSIAVDRQTLERASARRSAAGADRVQRASVLARFGRGCGRSRLSLAAWVADGRERRHRGARRADRGAHRRARRGHRRGSSMSAGSRRATPRSPTPARASKSSRRSWPASTPRARASRSAWCSWKPSSQPTPPPRARSSRRRPASTRRRRVSSAARDAERLATAQRDAESVARGRPRGTRARCGGGHRAAAAATGRPRCRARGGPRRGRGVRGMRFDGASAPRRRGR